MGFAELTQTQGWKNFMGKLYGLGAAIVILGALFKITHWPGATIMLTVGLVTEAIIFIFSAFEPIHEDIDWTIVYPELAGISEESEIGIPIDKGVAVAVAGGSIGSSEAITKFNDMLDKAGEKGIFEKFSTGLNNLNDNVSNLKNLEDATVATKDFANDVKAASKSVTGLSNAYSESTDVYKQSSENLNMSVEVLADAYSKTSQKVAEGNDNVTNAYQKLTDSMNIDFTSVADGNSVYNENITSLNKNLSAVNAIFEMQLDDANLEEMIKDIQQSAEFSKKYNEEVSKLGDRLEALNNVYGNMLSAMNVNV